MTFAWAMLLALATPVILSSTGCDPDSLAVYKVFLHTSWSREIFPKQYPEWRPPAQWSKLIGRSHDNSYVLFRLNTTASKGVKGFAEKGETEVLDAESQGEGGIFDEFNAPPISQGVGDSEAEFFIDGKHSKVSLMSRIVPSPDWFIGIDSFDLCVEGKLIESVVIEVDPMDAGTDNGFTFTSPNWVTVPQKPVSRITSRQPNHPASSFFYPDRIQHPPIATFHLVKVKEYSLSRVFEASSPRSSLLRYSVNDLFMASDDYDVSNDIDRSPSIYNHDLLNTLVHEYKKKKSKKNRRGRKSARRTRAPRDCRVSEWSPWSACSKTCGIGEQVSCHNAKGCTIRTRDVLKHARRGGRPCPLLEEQQWCGSSRDCNHKYFDW